uniref:tumor necrosis factor receptor superfamily member 4-like n=1 Tax=Myxine glutinosa TaxID=7769 RepID=UPI00358E6BF6
MRSPCVDHHKKTLCGPCPPSMYNALPNYARSCRRCTQCYTDFGQVVLQECLQSWDTQCGCPEGTYRSRDDMFFSCLDCAKAPLAQSPAECKTSSTTVTPTSGSCPEGWFGTDRCLPCTRCKREKHPCNATSDAICYPTSDLQQLGWLVLLVLPLLLVGLILICRNLLCPRLHSFVKAAGRRQKVLVAEETQAMSGRGSHTLVVTGQAAGRGWADGGWCGTLDVEQDEVV